MRYNMTTPCDECPFNAPSGFKFSRLQQFARGEFPCHKACDIDEETGNFVARKNGKTPHCAGALIFLERKGKSHQMMRIAERLGMYDRTKLDRTARVVYSKADCPTETR